LQKAPMVRLGRKAARGLKGRKNVRMGVDDHADLLGSTGYSRDDSELSH